MARSKEYMMKVLENFKIQNAKDSKDIDEIMKVICNDHIKEGHQLGKEDIALMRDCIREKMEEYQNVEVTEVIGTVTGPLIKAIKPQLKTNLTGELVDFASTISAKDLTLKTIGEVLPKVAISSMTRNYVDKLAKEGVILTQDQIMAAEAATMRTWGKFMNLTGRVISSL